MSKTIKQLLDKAEELGWSYSPCEFTLKDFGYEFEAFSTYGQDFIFCIQSTDKDGKETADALIQSLRDYIDAFDPSEEARIWAGASSTQQELSDIVDDMYECRQMMDTLLTEWEHI